MGLIIPFRDRKRTEETRACRVEAIKIMRNVAAVRSQIQDWWRRWGAKPPSEAAAKAIASIQKVPVFSSTPNLETDMVQRGCAAASRSRLVHDELEDDEPRT